MLFMDNHDIPDAVSYSKGDMEGYYYRAPGTDPCINLAIEEYLIKYCGKMKKPILYIWQNHDTVVIGRNQCAYRECDLRYAEENGIKVVRRLTGGGAVFHDEGNINYSFILPVKMHDTDLSTKLVIEALGSIGIEAVKDGRNDICADGLKISGNAYYTDKNTGLHHGTLLLKADRERMAKVLSVPVEKLKSKGIASVRSRVGDIASYCPDVCYKDVEKALRTAFINIYGIDHMKDIIIHETDLEDLVEKYRSNKWNIEKVSIDSMGSDEL